MSSRAYIGRTEHPVVQSETGRTRTFSPDMLLAAVKRLRILAFILLGFFVYSSIVTGILPAIRLKTFLTGGEDLAQVLRRIHLVQGVGIGSALAMIGVTSW